MAYLRILLHIRASGGGGAERVFAALANEFAARGHEVTLAVDLAIDADQLLPAVDVVAHEQHGRVTLDQRVDAARGIVRAAAGHDAAAVGLERRNRQGL